MHISSRVRASRLFAAGLCVCLTVPALAQISVRSVKVLGSKDTVEIEVEASDRIVPQSQVLTGPDRLVVDFPNTLPSSQIRNQSIDRGEVKDVRVGLFQSKPPVTRIVLDLKSARSYQIFPYGRTVMIKVLGEPGASNSAARVENNSSTLTGRPGLITANYTTSAEPVHVDSRAAAPLQVSYRNGLLSVFANKATLSEVLYAIQQRTGAEISIPAGAEQEKVVAEIEPAPAPEVLTRLLNGSRFNFMIVSAPDDPQQLDRVLLSTRSEGGSIAPLPQSTDDEPIAQEPPVARNEPQAVPPVPGPTPPPPQAELKDDGPEQ